MQRRVDAKNRSWSGVDPVSCIGPETDEVNRRLDSDPDECFGFDAYEPECPVDAITVGRGVPAKWHELTNFDAPRCRGARVRSTRCGFG
jgi:NAD-dependent dihydropyrimidine dehydrogenase PreA subunit